MSVDVLLITMPFSAIEMPSIQLGTLKALLRRDGVSVEVCHFNVRFAEYVVAALADRPVDEQLSLEDFSKTSDSTSLGDWIFSVPPLHQPTEDTDEEFGAWVLAECRDPTVFAKAKRFRNLVPAFLDQCLETIVASEPRIVGFTSTFAQNVASLGLAKRLKERAPHISIVFGGANCEGTMGAALHRLFPWIDVVVRGEAEHIIAPLVSDLIAGRPVRDLPGLCVRRNGVSVALDMTNERVPMADIPPPDYDEYFSELATSSLQHEIVPRVRIPYESSRGCWWGEKHHCTFCGLNGKTMTFRSKPAEQTYAEMVSLSERYRCVRFSAVDNIIELGYLRELLPRMRDTGWDWDVFYETKANLSKEQLRVFRAAGVRLIQPGIESLSTSILKLMNKGITELQNIRLLKWCAELEITPVWNLIYGFPGEDPSEYTRMADTMRSLVHMQAPNPAKLVLQRFSPYFQDPKRYGLELVGPDAYNRWIYPTIDRADLLDLVYAFEYRYVDGRTPASYVAPALEALETWRTSNNHGALTYRRGPGFLTIDDHRTTVEPASFTFDEQEALIYLACDAGATPRQIYEDLLRHGHAEFSTEQIGEFLDGLVEMRLVFAERGRYLSLATAKDPQRAMAQDRLGPPAIESEPPPPAPALIQLRSIPH